jgi:hypothetical protein
MTRKYAFYNDNFDYSRLRTTLAQFTIIFKNFGKNQSGMVFTANLRRHEYFFWRIISSLIDYLLPLG